MTTTTTTAAHCQAAVKLVDPCFAFQQPYYRQVMADGSLAKDREPQEAPPASALPAAAAAAAEQQPEVEHAAPSPYYFAKGLRKVHPYKCGQLSRAAGVDRNAL